MGVFSFFCKSTMPVQQTGKSQKRKSDKQDRARRDALDDEDALFGRVIKPLGERQFRVVVPHKERLSDKPRLIEVQAKIPKKRCTISINDIVIVAKSGGTYEIQGNMESRQIHRLNKERRIHPGLLLTGDWDVEKLSAMEEGGFEFDYDVGHTEVDADADVDVDAI